VSLRDGGRHGLIGEDAGAFGIPKSERCLRQERRASLPRQRPSPPR
jgi:hypothetical protein